MRANFNFILFCKQCTIMFTMLCYHSLSLYHCKFTLLYSIPKNLLPCKFLAKKISEFVIILSKLVSRRLYNIYIENIKYSLLSKMEEKVFIDWIRQERSAA